MRLTRVLYWYAAVHMDTGSPRALVGVVDLLDRARFEPLFLAAQDGPLVDALRARHTVIVRGTAGSVSWRRPMEAIRRVRQLRHLLREQAVDLVHVNELGWNTDLLLAARSLGIPVILHVHLREALMVTNLNWRLASHIAVVSEAQRGWFGAGERMRRRISVLHNPVDAKVFESGRPIRDALGLEPADVAVLTVAQVRPDKGIHVVLDVAERLVGRRPGLVFLIVGRLSDEAYAAQLQQRAAAPALRGRVRFLGSRSDVPDVLASCDVFLLPTREETFGIAVAEAMAAGLPVVVGAAGGVAEIVDDASRGWAVPGESAADYCRALEEVLNLPDRGRAVGEEGRRSLQGRFDMASSAVRLAELYNRVLR